MDAVEQAKWAFYDYEQTLDNYAKLPDDDPRIIKLQALMEQWRYALAQCKVTKKSPVIQGRQSLQQLDECIKLGKFLTLDWVSLSHTKPLTNDERQAAVEVMHRGGSVSDLSKAIHRNHDGVLRLLVTGTFAMQDVAEWRWLMAHRYMAKSSAGKVIYRSNLAAIRMATGLSYVGAKKAINEGVQVGRWKLIRMNHDNIPENTRF
ncbi:hypothetical protein ACI3E1_07555 [Ligilactobacillus sp. LYQ139]|uniref:hypothetical protein n=1 Tax=Ligilactobacillus sp. LYQ139 TaxID=3378800 RepID=UPI003854A61E